MGRIKSKDTKPEIKLRKALWHLGYRYRKNVKALPGSPDIVFIKNKLVVFIDGEFWHGFNWNEKRERIKKNRDFWIPKIERNMQRDVENNKKLIENGYTVMRFWEFQVKNDFYSCLKYITQFIDEEAYNNFSAELLLYE